MAIPRVAIIAIVGAIVAGAAFFATRPAATEPVVAPPAPVAPAEPGPVSKPESRSSESPASRVPPSVSRAVDEGKVVVLMFAQERGAEDRATRRRVERLGDTGGPALRGDFKVFVDGVDDLADYAAIVGSLGITQAPATVILSPDGEARVVEGFVDSRSLRQHVIDALG